MVLGSAPPGRDKGREEERGTGRDRTAQATYEEDLLSTGLGLQDETTGEVESEWAGRGSKERAGEEGM